MRQSQTAATDSFLAIDAFVLHKSRLCMSFLFPLLKPMRILPCLLLVISPAMLIGAPGLTIYNQNFAAVRDTIPLDLKQGENDVKYYP